MPRNLEPHEIREILAEVGLSGSSIETLVENSPRQLTLGQMAKLGVALEQIGKQRTELAREAAKKLCGPEKEYRFEFVDDGVHFTYRTPYDRTSVNTKKVEAVYPKIGNPEWWNTSEVKETIAISLE